MKKIKSFVAFLLVMVMAMSAVIVNAADKKSDDVTEITFWFANGGPVIDYVEEATKRFNETIGEEKGIHVTSEFQGEYMELHQKLQAAYISETAPDLTVLEIAGVGLFAEGGMIEPLSPFIEKEKDEIDIEDFHEGLLYNCIIDEETYTLPFLRSTSILYINKDICDEAGVKVEKLETWDDYKKASEKINKKTGKIGFTIPMNYWFWEAFMLSEGGFTVNEDETEITVDNEISRKIIAYFQDLMEREIGSVYSYAEADKLRTDVMNQDAAFWFGSTGSLTQFLAVAKDLDFELVTKFIPKGDDQGVTVGGCNIAMLSGLPKEKQEASWEFIKFMTTTEETVTQSIATGYLASRKSALEDERLIELYTEQPQFKVALDQLEIAVGRPNNPGYQEFQIDVTLGISDIIVSGADVDEVLKNLEEKGTEGLND